MQKQKKTMLYENKLEKLSETDIRKEVLRKRIVKLEIDNRFNKKGKCLGYLKKKVSSS